MGALIFCIISVSGVNSLLLPASPHGVTTGFSTSKGTEAIFYNPAYFEANENYAVWSSYNRFYLSMQSVSLALSKKIAFADCGIAFVNFDYGDLEWRPDYPTDDSLTYYTANDFLIVLGASVPVTPQGKIGLNLKYILESIHIYSDYTLAFDVSFSYRSEKAGISFGTSNFGSKITLKNESVNLPARLSIGAFYTMQRIMPSVDLHYLVNNGAVEGGVGVSIPLSDIFVFHTAAQYREQIYPAYGLEVKVRSLLVTYAGAIYPKDLGLINTIGIGFEF